jgi:hypothetical protein
MRHVSTPESTIKVGVIRSRMTRVSIRSLLSGEAGSSVERCVVVLDPSWMARGSRASGHVIALEPSETQGRGLEPYIHDSAGALSKQGGGFQYYDDTWQHVNLYLTFFLNLQVPIHLQTKSLPVFPIS